MSEFDCGNCSVKQTKVHAVFRLSIDDKGIIWPRAIILSSGNNLNMENTFVGLTEELPQSNSDNNYSPQTDQLSRFILYPPDKIWIWPILLSASNKEFQNLILT